MKRILSLFALTTLAVGCQNATNEKLVQMNGLNFTAPEAWEVIYYSSSAAQLQVPANSETDLDYLTLNLYKNDTADLADAEMVGSNGDVTVYDMICGGAIACYYLQVGESVYDVDFDISSTEQPPTNLDGVWKPDVEVSTQEMIDFLLTAETSGN